MKPAILDDYSVVFLHRYRSSVEYARRMHNVEDAEARRCVVGEMEPHVLAGSVIVPVPSSSGVDRYMAVLAEELAARVPGATSVEAVIRHTPVRSSYKCRLAGDPSPTLEEHIASMEQTAHIVGSCPVYVIDNVMRTGNTIAAVIHHLDVEPRRVTVLIYADATSYRIVATNPSSIRCCICGSRSYKNSEVIVRVLMTLPKSFVIVHGDARGADTVAARLASSMGFEVEAWPADWKKHGRAAGYIRNREMIETCDYVIAFWDGQSHGTLNSINLAHEMGIDCEVIL